MVVIDRTQELHPTLQKLAPGRGSNIIQGGPSPVGHGAPEESILVAMQ